MRPSIRLTHVILSDIFSFPPGSSSPPVSRLYLLRNVDRLCCLSQLPFKVFATQRLGDYLSPIKIEHAGGGILYYRYIHTNTTYSRVALPDSPIYGVVGFLCWIVHSLWRKVAVSYRKQINRNPVGHRKRKLYGRRL